MFLTILQSLHRYYPVLSFFVMLQMGLNIIAHEDGHTEKGTSYGNQGINIYAQTKHGPDGGVFLDPFFIPYLQNLGGQVLLDAGCGAGPWTIYAAQNGAIAYGIDIQEGMIETAKQASIKAGLGDRTEFLVGDVGNLPYSSESFDRAISINVGCNLPNLEPHIKELFRVLKKGGLAIITAPTSFGIVFTDGIRPNTVVVDDVNNILMENTQKNILPPGIKNFHEIYRATFALRQGEWTLVLNDKELIQGEEIWRKIPNMVVPNRYHSEEEYLAIFSSEGFKIKNIYSSVFQSEQERDEFNRSHERSLGEEYLYHSPFLVFVIEKE